MNNAVKYGLILTGTIVVWLAVMHSLGAYSAQKTEMSIVDYFYVLVPAIVLYLGIKEKKKMSKNRLTYKEGVIEGLRISVIYGVLSPIVFYLYYTLVNPDAIQFAKKAYGMMQFSDREVMFADLAVQFVFSILGGLIMSLVISYFLSKKAK